MKHFNTQRNKHSKGFTLIETIVAILILSLTIGALLTLTANGIFSVRYARNQIVANNLAQEALEYIRNNRDTARQQSISWSTWLRTTFNVDTNGNNYDLGTPYGCFSAQGCIVDPYTDEPHKVWQQSDTGSCSTDQQRGCKYIWFYPDTGFYTYASRSHLPAYIGTTTGVTAPVRTTYTRTIHTTSSSPDQLTVTVTMVWNNGVTQKTLSQSMVLANWAQ